MIILFKIVVIAIGLLTGYLVMDDNFLNQKKRKQ